MTDIVFCDGDPRRVALTLAFALWLSFQMLLVGISPAWGFVLPHEHLTRGALNQAQWQEHLRAHRAHTTVFYDSKCDGVKTTNSVIASFPNGASALSVTGFLNALVGDELTQIPSPRMPVATWRVAAIHSRELVYSPPEPPPNF